METISLSYIETADIHTIIRDALKQFEQEFEERAIDVDTALMHEPPAISANQEQLTKAIAERIENAIEAMTGETKILRISTGVSESRLEIVISDTGKGISKEKLKNIFDPLDQVSFKNETCPAGSTLGMMCKVDPCVKTPKVLFLKCISPLCEMVLTGS